MEQLRRALTREDDTRGALRDLGGLLLATGFLMAFIRKSNPGLGDPWGAGGIFLTLAIPAAFLYGTAVLGRDPDRRVRAWQLVYLVFGLILIPLALSALVDWLGSPGDSGNALNVLWIFLVTAAAGAFAAGRIGARYALFLAGISLLIAWIALWDKILSGGVGGHLTTLRFLFLVAAILLLALSGAFRMRFPGTAGSSAGELVTVAGIAAIIGTAGLSVTAVFSQIPFVTFPTASATWVWDTLALLAAVALIVYGARTGMRGPAYIGGFGLLLFIVVAGLDFDSSTPQGKIVGWPLLLVILGALAFAGSVMSGAPEDRPPAPPPPQPGGPAAP